jgi:hypothetical protein
MLCIHAFVLPLLISTAGFGDKQGIGSLLSDNTGNVALNALKVDAFLAKHSKDGLPKDSSVTIEQLVSTFQRSPSLLAEMSRLLEVGDGLTETNAGSTKKSKFGKLKKRKTVGGGGTIDLPPKVLAEVIKQSKMAAARWCDPSFAKHFLGNSLSIYWYARALAMLAGIPFNAPCKTVWSWINLLPQEHTPNPAEASFSKLTTMMSKCSVYRPHECTHGWNEPALHKLIKSESNEALAKHMKEGKVGAARKCPPLLPHSTPFCKT